MISNEKRAHELAARAAEAAAALPPLAVDSRKSASTVHRGSHGKRRKGAGEEFWQIRAAREGDPRRLIDWRRSARSDTHFVREKELTASERVLFWVDRSSSMSFASSGNRTKADRARLIALATSMLLERAEDHFGLAGGTEAPGTGRAQLERMALELLSADETEYGTPPRTAVTGGILVYISDFLGPWHPFADAVRSAAASGVSGALVQILDPCEQSFPFRGRTEFRSMDGGIRFETLWARGLRDQYLAMLGRRQADITELAKDTGWQCVFHGTGEPASSGIAKLHRLLASGK